MNKPNPDTDLLRRAATKARETAQAATADVCPDWTWLAVRHVARNCDLECPTHGDDHEKCNQWDRYDDSPHMTLWHPQVTNHITAMLACAASVPERDRDSIAQDRCGRCGTPHLVDIAQALLGEDT